MRFSIASVLVALLFAFVHADQRILHDYEGLQTGRYGVAPSQTYHSSNITSPLFNYDIWHEGLVAGDGSSHILLTLTYNESGPYIFRDDDLSLVYADSRFVDTTNARIQTVNGSDYLSFWHGGRADGRGAGFCVFYDDHYQLRWNVTAVSPATVNADMHECQVTNEGTVLLTVYQNKPYNLTAQGFTGNDTLTDGCFQEIDLATNDLVFMWCASEHFRIDLSFRDFELPRPGDAPVRFSPNSGLDAYHINSVQKTSEGHYLVSLRPFKMVIYINGTSGQPIWYLGGKVNNFTDVTPASVLASNPGSGKATEFGWQHDVKFTDASLTQMTLFDNHNLDTSIGCTGSNCSRGRLLELDAKEPDNLRVQLIRDYRLPQGAISGIMGSMQRLSYGQDGRSNMLIGWGAISAFTEYTYSGQVVRNVQFSVLDSRSALGRFGEQTSYRAYKQSWHGYPPWPPSVALDDQGRLRMSWNGATEVHRWAVYGSSDLSDLGETAGFGYQTSTAGIRLETLQAFITKDRAGFETTIEVTGVLMEFLKVAALDVDGRTIGSSETVQTSIPSLSWQLDCLVLGSMLLPR